MRIVLASNNAKKLAELQALLRRAAGGAGDAGLAGHPRGGGAACHLPRKRPGQGAPCVGALSGLPALADDSGLCVDALGGAPGVASAHYAPAPDGVTVRARGATPRAGRRQQRLAAAAPGAACRPPRGLRQHAGGAAPRRRPRAAGGLRPLGRRDPARAARRRRLRLRPADVDPGAGPSGGRARRGHQEPRQPPRAGRRCQLRERLREAWHLG
jgi:hypothetical protein